MAPIQIAPPSACVVAPRVTPRMKITFSVSRVRLLVAMVIMSAVLEPVSATYIDLTRRQESEDRSNDIASKEGNLRKRGYASLFSGDREILQYLKLYGTGMMIWRCKKAIQPYFTGDPIPVVELYCEVIGTLQAISWYRNGQKLKLDGHYGQSIMPHYANGQYYSTWIEFRLRMYDATPADSGVYAFEAVSLDGVRQRQAIYVDISGAKKKRKDKGKGRSRKKNQKSRQQRQ